MAPEGNPEGGVERIVLVLVLTLVLGASALPYWVSWNAVPENRSYAGTPEASVDDFPTYLTKMRAGARGTWFYRSPYAPELESTLHVRPLYGLLGAITGALGAPLWLGFHVGRLLLGGLCILVLARIAAVVSRSRGERICILLLTVVGSGVGGFLGRDGPRVSWSYDLWVPELNASYSILSNAHFPAALLLMGLVLLSAGRAFDRQEPRQALLGGLCLGVLALIHPYDLIPVTATLVIFGLWALARRDLSARSLLTTALILGGLALPFVAYEVASLRLDPSLAQMGLSQPVGSPWALVTGLGLLLPLALVGLGSLRGRGATAGLLTCWALLVPVLLLVPFPFVRRMLVGWHVPLGLLAGIGLWRLAARVGGGRLRVAAAAGGIALCAFTNVEIVWHQVERFRQVRAGLPTALPNDLLESYAWFTKNARAGDVVLAPYGPSNWLPVYTDLRPWFGHWAEAPDARSRSAQAQIFFAPKTSERLRLDLLRSGGIDWVMSGKGMPFGPGADIAAAELPGVTVVHRQGVITILQVSRDQLPAP